jgi:hypothetical protein
VSAIGVPNDPALRDDLQRSVSWTRPARARSSSSPSAPWCGAIRLLSKAPGFVSYEPLKPEGDDGAVTLISVFNSRAEAM